jgi:hypothetical protein
MNGPKTWGHCPDNDKMHIIVTKNGFLKENNVFLFRA